MDDLPDDSKSIVEISEGLICGYIDKQNEGTFHKFKNIPYAKPPLGNLRFMPPIPPKPWANVCDCTADAPPPLCMDVGNTIIGSEDCLYIEVHTPNLKPDKLMPVMFWIGSYNYLFYIDHLCDPTLIINQDIVFVRCGSRLGPFGFLSINDISAPGNVGLKDIVMALKWVQRNITIFGGDPANVTLFGSGTGGSTVHFMMLSPMATGLFHKAVMQSSSALNRWALAKNPSQAVLELAKELSINKTNKYDIVEELRLIPAFEIMKAYVRLSVCAYECDEGDTFDAMFKPCVEEEFEGQPVFLNKSPAVLIKAGNFNKVPIIIGSNNIEASVLQYMKEDFYADFEKFNKDVSLLVPKSLALDECFSKKIGKQLLNFYFRGTETLNEHTRTQYLQLLSDYYFLYYVNKTVTFHSQYAPDHPVYYYIVNYAGEWSVPKLLDFFNSIGHSAEVSFLFRIKPPDLPHCKGSRDSVTTRNRVIKMWTNFAKYGNPTPDENDPLLQITWDPIHDEKTLNYLSIGSELTKGRNPFYERMMFWEKLHEEHLFLRTLVYFNDIGVQW
ncbi:juvenile hormone esterase-like [Maniola jurtina]|uniref:juvenile hormone esterase-like n=1 Tax=Maniola jurtina TaxID=191418 RepID=UPI001E686F3C|nr:juvenile hormone esterase-like [Maniola jurtina]XP_045765487.1 juvenile hormone esterase-like [Maniola jurtina]XP_045765488.1 juvenile hormone esterase-like [Maniola jurtina]